MQTKFKKGDKVTFKQFNIQTEGEILCINNYGIAVVAVCPIMKVRYCAVYNPEELTVLNS